VNLLVVSEDSIIREALKSLLTLQPDFQVVGTASSLTLELPANVQSAPVVVLVDLPTESSGMVAISRVKKVFPEPETRILILSSVEDRFNVERLVRAGAAGVVFKRVDVNELVLAIKTVAKGDTYVDRAFMSRVVTPKTLEPGQGKPRTLDLSSRERQVLTYIASGHTHKDIAEKLRISVKTVETYRYRMVEKLGLRSRAELVKYALQHGLFHLSSLIPLLLSNVPYA
jgi:two-component system, NarL family, response regulator NreC